MIVTPAPIRCPIFLFERERFLLKIEQSQLAKLSSSFSPPQLTQDNSVFRNPRVTYFLDKLLRCKNAKWINSIQQNESD